MIETIPLSFDSCWFEAPRERTPPFFPTYIRVSVAIQTRLRRRLPEIYLADIERFRDTRMVYPLLVYAASRPFSSQSRTDYSYDILNPKLMRRFHYSVRRNLPKTLEQVSQRLRAEGMDDAAKHYRAAKSSEIIELVDRLKICRRRLEAVIVAESRLIDALFQFAGSGGLPPKARAKVAGNVSKEWLSILRRLYARKDFRALGTELVAEAGDIMRSPADKTAPFRSRLG
ncbi:MAG: hypothetical protein ABSH09_28305 [Bryobacteraceae bacterium]|jgi:hypothetical protein